MKHLGIGIHVIKPQVISCGKIPDYFVLVKIKFTTTPRFLIDWIKKDLDTPKVYFLYGAILQYPKSTATNLFVLVLFNTL